MRFLMILLCTAFCSAAFATSNIFGHVEKDAYKAFLTAGTQCERYLIQASTADAQQSLKKLDSGDTLTGSGEYNHANCTVDISTIDYVGLKKMLGLWHSNEGILDVHNFESMSFYPIDLQDFKTQPEYQMANPTNYRYSVTPSDGREWVVFMSDAVSTSFATIQFNKKSALMRIYDSENGRLTRTLRLTRWSNP